MSEAKDGTVNTNIPQNAPTRKAVMVLNEMRNDIPHPTVAYNIEAIAIVLVEGKATRLMKL